MSLAQLFEDLLKENYSAPTAALMFYKEASKDYPGKVHIGKVKGGTGVRIMFPQGSKAPWVLKELSDEISKRLGFRLEKKRGDKWSMVNDVGNVIEIDASSLQWGHAIVAFTEKKRKRR